MINLVNNTGLHGLRFWSQKVLPLTYTDSLSYLEVLYKVVDKLNDTIKRYNELTENVNETITAVNDFEKRLITLEASFNETIERINKEFEDLSNELNLKIDSSLSDMQNQIDALTKSVQEQINALDKNLTNRIDSLQKELTETVNSAIMNMEKLISDQLTAIRKEMAANNEYIKAWVEDEIRKLIDSIPDLYDIYVNDPVLGGLHPLQRVLDHIFELMRHEAITAAEYDALKLSADEYDHYRWQGIPKGLTAYLYDYFARRILLAPYRNRIRHPATGKKVKEKIVIAFNTDLLKESGSYTAAQYDQTKVPANVYDSYHATAYNYDWKSNRFIAWKEGDEPLPLPSTVTAEHYDSLNLSANDYDNKLLTAYQYDTGWFFATA